MGCEEGEEIMGITCVQQQELKHSIKTNSIEGCI